MKKFTLIELLVKRSHLCCDHADGNKDGYSPVHRQVKQYCFTLIELLVTTAQQNCFSKIKKYTSLRPTGRTSRFFCECKKSSSHLHIFTRSAFAFVVLFKHGYLPEVSANFTFAMTGRGGTSAADKDKLAKSLERYYRCPSDSENYGFGNPAFS